MTKTARCPFDGATCQSNCGDECRRTKDTIKLEPPLPGFPVRGNRPVWQLSTNGAADDVCQRRAVAEKEGTRDPIFLFQVKRFIHFPSASGFEWPEGWVFDDDGGIVDADGETVTDEDCEANNCARHYWETEAVFSTREGARVHGSRRPYAWGAENKGWRVYAVTCEGQLAELLVIHWKQEP